MISVYWNITIIILMESLSFYILHSKFLHGIQRSLMVDILICPLSLLSMLFQTSQVYFVKLDSSNYLLCLYQFLSVLCTYELLGIVDDIEPCPPKYPPTWSPDNQSLELTFKFASWIKQDQFILSWINAALINGFLSTACGLNASLSRSRPPATRFTSHSRNTSYRGTTSNKHFGKTPNRAYVLLTKKYANQFTAIGKNQKIKMISCFILEVVSTLLS